MTTQTKSNPWNAWNLWTTAGAVVFGLLWLVFCGLGFGKMTNAITPSIDPLAFTTIITTPLTVSGLGTPGTNVQIKYGDKTVWPVAVGADGKWRTDLDLNALSGKIAVVAQVLDAKGNIMASSQTVDLDLKIPGSGIVGFDYPGQNEELNAQDYALSGTSTPNQTYDIWQQTPSGTNKFDTVVAGPDGHWGSYVPKADIGTTPGKYVYELRETGSDKVISQRTVIVKAGLTQASNVQCPCRLRVFTNRKQNIKNAKIVLFKDGAEVDSGVQDKLFTALDKGNYTYSVTAPGYENFTSGTANLPKNKNFEVYLKLKK